MKLIRVTIYLISLALVGIAAYQKGRTDSPPMVLIQAAPSPTPEPKFKGRLIGFTPEEMDCMKGYVR